MRKNYHAEQAEQAEPDAHSYLAKPALLQPKAPLIHYQACSLRSHPMGKGLTTEPAWYFLLRYPAAR